MRFYQSPFFRLFAIREGQTLAGKNYKNILYLFSILFLTYFVIGFSSGCLEYLSGKMNDPFINWLVVKWPSTGPEMKDVMEDLDQNKSKRFLFEEVRTGHTPYLYFRGKNQKDELFEGRTIDPGSPVMNRILSEEFLQKGKKQISQDELGLLVTRETLRKLGYAEDEFPAFLNWSRQCATGNYEEIPIPISGIVNDLPNTASFSVSPIFWDYYYGNPVFDITDTTKNDYLSTISFFLPGNSNQKKFEQLVQQTLAKAGLKFGGSTTEPEEESHEAGNRYTTTLYSKLGFSEYLTIAQKISKESKILGIQLVFDFKGNYQPQVNPVQPHFLSVYFSGLDSIKPFQDYMLDRHKLKIDLTQIDAKENFNFVSKSTYVISYFLIAFSIVCIALFVRNLIAGHLEKIRKNIGTFKAFGLSNRKLLWVYSSIMLGFVVGASLAGFLFAWILGQMGLVRFLLSLLQVNLEKGHAYFNLFTSASLVAFLMASGFTYLFTYLGLRQFLKNTPGDLIYERD
jgi:ABC-type antimicrobial peptide transport system permease subunit